MNIQKLAFYFGLGALVLAAFCFYRLHQPVVDYSKCKLCDGNEYLMLYRLFKEKRESDVRYPYYKRILTPALASQLPFKDAITNFQIVNCIFLLLGMLAIYYLWKSLELPFHLVFMGLFWLLFHWSGPLRYYAQDPVTVDVPLLFFQSLFLIVFVNRRFRWLWVIAPLAVLQKESCLAIVFSLLLIVLFYLRKCRLYTWRDVNEVVVALALSILIPLVVGGFMPSYSDTRSFIYPILSLVIVLVSGPFKAVRWLVANFMAYGNFMVVGMIFFKKKDFLKNPFYTFLTLNVCIYLFFGLFAGEDITRILFLGTPFTLTFIFLVVKEVPRTFAIAACILSLPIMKLTHFYIPDFDVALRNSKDWYVEYASRGIVMAWFAYFIFCTAVLVSMKNIKLQ